LIVRVPLADPVLGGANYTPTWQLSPGATALAQSSRRPRSRLAGEDEAGLADCHSL